MIKRPYTVYAIYHNGVIRYIGKSHHFVSRRSQHLRRGKGSAIPKDIDLSAITIKPLFEFEDNTEALKCEDKLICEYNTIETGWNHVRSGLITHEEWYSIELERKHQDNRVEWNRQYRANNRDEYNAKCRDYYYRGGYEAKKRYIATHRDQINARRRERRAKLKAEKTQ